MLICGALVCVCMKRGIPIKCDQTFWTFCVLELLSSRYVRNLLSLFLSSSVSFFSYFSFFLSLPVSLSISLTVALSRSHFVYIHHSGFYFASLPLDVSLSLSVFILSNYHLLPLIILPPLTLPDGTSSKTFEKIKKSK